MAIDQEQRTRERAYFLWEKEGSPDGQSDLYWERAELLERQESAPSIVTPLQTAMAENKVDESLEETFPASDPPSYVAVSATKAKTGKGSKK